MNGRLRGAHGFGITSGAVSVLVGGIIMEVQMFVWTWDSFGWLLVVAGGFALGMDSYHIIYPHDKERP